MPTSLILPPLRRSASDAARFATIVYKSRTDDSRKSYIKYLTRVAICTHDLSKNCPFWSHEERDEAAQIAWLHEVTKEMDATAETLRAEGFTEAVIAGVLMLSKPLRTGFCIDWIRDLIEKAPLSVILVELAILEVNTDPKRAEMLSEETQLHLQRTYAGAIEMLRSVARGMGWQG